MKHTLTLLAALLLAPLAALQAAEAPKPNIVFIYADDWGWGDLSCHGNTWLKTPRLDKLASEGIDFQQFNVLSPICSPSRAAALTGRFPGRFGINTVFGVGKPPEMPDWLDPKAPTTPRLLKVAGYRTGHFGKWHLGEGKPTMADYGFDESAVYHGPGPKVGPYGNDIPNQAVKFIEANKDRPFYVNVWLHESHLAHSPSDESMARWKHLAPRQQVYAAVITDGDNKVGMILDALERSGIARNTLVVFSSDNGPAKSKEHDKGFPGKYRSHYSIGETSGLRGQKTSLFEGGVRVPFIVRWPGHAPAGLKNDASVLTAVDLLPTFCAAAGVTPPTDANGDGENMLPALKGEPLLRTRPIFWRINGNKKDPDFWPDLAVRDGDWKLATTFDGQRVELHDLKANRSEDAGKDAAQAHPKITLRLSKLVRDWHATLPTKADPSCLAKPQESGPKKLPEKAAPKSEAPAKDRSTPFHRWDTNKDGFLTFEEYKAGQNGGPHLEARYKRFDKDGDGKVSRKEFPGDLNKLRLGAVEDTIDAIEAATEHPPPRNTTYVIDPVKGDDANPAGKPWRTFGKLNAFKLAPGDKVVVASGQQEESLKPMGGGTADNPVVIQFLPGIHTINIRNVTRVPLFVSNTMDSDDPKPVGILLEGCKHLRLQGGGVEGEEKTTILFDGRMVQICNNYSEDITFTGLVFDLKRPTVSEFRVLEAGTAYAVIQVAEGSDYSVEDGKFLWRGDWGPGAFCQKLDLKEGRCRRFQTPRGWEAQGQSVATARDLGGRKVRLDYSDGESGLESGHQYHFRNIKRDSVGVHNNRSKDILFKDCDFYALTGMGFVSQFTENITFQRVNVAPPRDTIRTCPAWADILHFANCKGNILIDSCRFSGMQDDAINCHGTYLYIVEKTKSNQVLVRFMHRQTYGFPAFVPGDEVAVISGPETREYPDNPRRKVTALERKSDRDWLLTLDGDVPHFQDKDVIDNRTWHPNITVANNHFSVAPVSGLNLLTPGKALVENNTFHRCRTCAVGMAVDSLSWFESAPVRDVLIRGNTFIECGVWVNPDLDVIQPEEPIHENIRIIDNVFVQAGVKAKGVRRLTITGNRPAAGPLPIEIASSCTEVKIENNEPRR